MKEYLYRRKVRYQCRPLFAVLDLVTALIIIFSGPFIFAVPTLVIFIKMWALSHSQVQYLIPRRVEEIKKQSNLNITMTCVEMVICMVIWLLPSLLLYKGVGAVIRQFPVFMILWFIALVLMMILSAVDTERSRWAGEIENYMTFSEVGRKDFLKGVRRLFDVFCILFLGMRFFQETTFMEKGWDFQKPRILSCLVVAIIVNIICICKVIKKWRIADYNTTKDSTVHSKE